jgi:hypothetical protein
VTKKGRTDERFQWHAGWPAIFCFDIATIVEIPLCHIPFVDNLTYSITMPVEVDAGIIHLVFVFPVDNDIPKWTRKNYYESPFTEVDI